MAVAIESRSLSKAYGDKVAVKEVNLEIKNGEFFGIIGPNGAGKTSILKMIYGFVPPTSGELYVLGLDIKKNLARIKKLIGVVPQENCLDTDFTALENLLLYAGYFGTKKYEALPRARELLRIMNLEDYEEQPVEKLSGGMQRRLTIARALMSRPEVLILDEPTTGLDPKARLWIWESLQTLKKKGVTIVLTTHYMEEAERLCNRVAIMDRGQVLGVGSPRDLIVSKIGTEVIEFNVDSNEMDYYLNRLKPEFDYQVFNNKVRLFLKSGQKSKEALELVSSDNITIRKASLDDVFLKFSGHEIAGELI